MLRIITNILELTTTENIILALLGNPILLSLLGARLLFSMKDAGAKGLNQGTSCNFKSTVSGMDFAEPLQVTTDQIQEERVENEAIEMEEIC